MEDININFKGLFRLIKENYLKYFLVIFITTSFGVLYAFYAREEFLSEGKILPEIQGKGSGYLSQFSGLASLAGVDLNSLGSSNIDAVRPDLYPDVISSTPFFIELFKHEVTNKENEKMRFDLFFNRYIENKKNFSHKWTDKYDVKVNNEIIISNRLFEKRVDNLRKRIIASIDKKTGIISISVKLPDPVVSAEVTRFGMEYLMNYVKLYRTEKLQKDVQYLSDQVDKSKSKYYSTQEKKAKYADSYQDIQLQSSDLKRERLEADYRLSSTFYNELLKKLEEAKFRLNQETPVFKVLEPPLASNFRSFPKRKIVVTLFFLFGNVIYFLLLLSNRHNFEIVFGSGDK